MTGTAGTADIEHHAVTVDGLTFDVRSAGPADGRLVLLLHGFPQTGAAWDEVLVDLGSAGHRAVAPDQRGYSPGARPGGRDAYRVDALADDALGIAARLGHDRFDLVGHDWGGVVGWHLAAERPEVLRTLTVVSTPHPRAFRASLTGLQALRSAYIPFFRVPGLAERVLALGQHRVLEQALIRSGLPPEAAARTIRRLRVTGGLAEALTWYRANGPELTRLGPSKAPTLYVWSTGDTALGRAAAERTGDHVDAHYRFEVLEGISHWIPETAPDVLAGLVRRHLAAHG